MAQIRKALVAAAGAGVSAAVAAISNGSDIPTAVGAGVAAALVVGWATWQVRNKPTV